MNYNDTLQKVEENIEGLLQEIMDNYSYKSPRSEERLTALCLGRQYILDKIGDNKNEQ